MSERDFRPSPKFEMNRYVKLTDELIKEITYWDSILKQEMEAEKIAQYEGEVKAVNLLMASLDEEILASLSVTKKQLQNIRTALTESITVYPDEEAKQIRHKIKMADILAIATYIYNLPKR